MISMNTKDVDGVEEDSLDNSTVRSGNLLHVVLDGLDMVIFDLLAAFAMQVKSVHMVVGGVRRDALLECDLRRRRRDVLIGALVLRAVSSCFENFDFTRGDGVQVVAGHDVTDRKNAVRAQECKRPSEAVRTWIQSWILGVRRRRRMQGWRK